MTHRVIPLAVAFLGACGPGITASNGPALHDLAPATIYVHYDTGFGHEITLRGSDGGLSWSGGVAMTSVSADTWVIQLDLSRPTDFKPLYDDSTWPLGPNYQVSPGQTLDVWPAFFHGSGTVQYWGDWASPSLGNTRGVWTYLPPSYSENASERYPVVYMHDAQNLFFDAQSFSGVSWNVQGAMDSGADDGSIHEAIIVGIENTSNRTWEYTPNWDASTMDGGGADSYLSAIMGELKPQIDASLRTYPDAAHTAMIGSSLGGLVTAYAGISHPEVFGLCGVLSPSTWWNGDWLVGAVASTSGRPQPLRVYLDSGDSGASSDDVSQTRALAQAYQSVGDDLDYLVQAGGQHGEPWWRERVPGTLAFLLGPR